MLDLAIHAQQHLNHGLTARVIDRFRLSPLHTPKFDSAELCPPNPLNAYDFWDLRLGPEAPLGNNWGTISSGNPSPRPSGRLRITTWRATAGRPAPVAGMTRRGRGLLTPRARVRIPPPLCEEALQMEGFL